MTERNQKNTRGEEGEQRGARATWLQVRRPNNHQQNRPTKPWIHSAARLLETTLPGGKPSLMRSIGARHKHYTKLFSAKERKTKEREEAQRGNSAEDVGSKATAQTTENDRTKWQKAHRDMAR